MQQTLRFCSSSANWPSIILNAWVATLNFGHDNLDLPHRNGLNQHSLYYKMKNIYKHFYLIA